jgi:hypothetical protein
MLDRTCLQRLRGEIEKLLSFHAQSRKRFVQQITEFEKFARQIPEPSAHCARLKLDTPPPPPIISPIIASSHPESLKKFVQCWVLLNASHSIGRFRFCDQYVHSDSIGVHVSHNDLQINCCNKSLNHNLLNSAVSSQKDSQINKKRMFRVLTQIACQKGKFQ